MKQFDDPKDQKENPPKQQGEGGKIVSLRKPTPNPVFDAEWFYDEEEFFAEHMDEFDW